MTRDSETRRMGRKKKKEKEEEGEGEEEGDVQKKNSDHPAATGFLSFLRPFFIYFSHLAPVNRSHPCVFDEIKFVVPIVTALFSFERLL